jgi:hypothetical protein
MEHKVGDRTEFSWGLYELKEILTNQNITMWRKLKEDICPHCKKVIEHKVECIFNTIEIWSKLNKNPIDIIEDISILGLATNGQYLLLPREKYPEIIKQSVYLTNRGE